MEIADIVLALPDPLALVAVPGAGLVQNHIERILAGWVQELAVPIYREREVTGFAQDDTGVDVEISGGRPLRAQYLVGCDGGRSRVRKSAGIEFPGWDPTTSALIGEVEMPEEPKLGIRHDAIGVHAFGKTHYEIRNGQVVFQDGGPIRVMVTERQVGPAAQPTLGELREALIAVYGTDYGIHSPASKSWPLLTVEAALTKRIWQRMKVKTVPQVL